MPNFQGQAYLRAEDLWEAVVIRSTRCNSFSSAQHSFCMKWQALSQSARQDITGQQWLTRNKWDSQVHMIVLTNCW